MSTTDLFSIEGLGVAVTGAASGIGLAIAEAMAENGASVSLIDIDGESLDVEVARLRDHGHDVRGDVADVTDSGALDAVIDGAAAAHGLDVVFANAGIDSGPGYVTGWAGDGVQRDPDGGFEHYSDERWQRAIDVNLHGVFTTTRAAVRHMRPQRSGRIIVTTSVASLKAEPAVGVAYMAAKAGAAHLVRNLALEMAAYGITVNSIGPGMFITNIGGGHAKEPGFQEMVSQLIPMRRVAFPDQIKGLALFLASPASAYVTGQEIYIDGGLSLGAGVDAEPDLTGS